MTGDDRELKIMKERGTKVKLLKAWGCSVKGLCEEWRLRVQIVPRRQSGVRVSVVG